MTNDYKTELIDLLETVIKESASDLHLSEGRNPTIRVAGSLIPLARKPVLKKEDTDAILSLLVTNEMRAQFETKINLPESEAKERALTMPEIQKWLGDVEIKKVIFIPNKIINFVI